MTTTFHNKPAFTLIKVGEMYNIGEYASTLEITMFPIMYNGELVGFISGYEMNPVLGSIGYSTCPIDAAKTTSEILKQNGLE